MRKQFLLHKLGGTFLIVDISGIGKEAQPAPTAQFTSWGNLEAHFLGLGATAEALNSAKELVERGGTTSLLI
jgi:hypothetical protein